MFQIPTADDLVTFIKDFTGSTNDEEIKKCIFMAELSMRNIELPALRDTRPDLFKRTGRIVGRLR